MSLIKYNRYKKILKVLLITVVIFLLLSQFISADDTKTRYFLTYDSFSGTFKDEITDRINEYRNKTHYKVIFNNDTITEMQFHYFYMDLYTITYYRGVDTPLKEITYKNIDDISIMDLISSMKENYNLLSSYLYSIKYYRDGLINRTELYRNGKLVAYKQRNYVYRYHTVLPYKEEHWVRSSGDIIKEKTSIKNSLEEDQLVYDGNGFELRTVWIYYDNDYQLFGYYYLEEDYYDGRLKYYHDIHYYEDMRDKLDANLTSLNYGEINKKEYDKRRIEILKTGNSTLISRIDDYKPSGKFYTRRFYSRLSKLIEVWYYDSNNVNRLVEYYNSDGDINGIDIKDTNGYLVETYNNTEVDLTFFLKIRNEILNENEEEEDEE